MIQMWKEKWAKNYQNTRNPSREKFLSPARSCILPISNCLNNIGNQKLRNQQSSKQKIWYTDNAAKLTLTGERRRKKKDILKHSTWAFMCVFVCMPVCVYCPHLASWFISYNKIENLFIPENRAHKKNSSKTLFSWEGQMECHQCTMRTQHIALLFSPLLWNRFLQ